jgi:hypothetical protein
MGVLVGDPAFFPGLGKVGKGQTVFRLKAAERLVAGPKLVLKALFGQVFQFLSVSYEA